VHIARVYDYRLGGREHLLRRPRTRREDHGGLPQPGAAGPGQPRFPGPRSGSWPRKPGIRQFLDIGTGIPTANNIHEVAQRVAPGSRIVYVDHDPLVLAHARSLLSSTPEGACAYLEGDLREPEAILSAAADTLDFSQPVAVMLIAVMHFIGDDAQARSILDRLTGACVPGSFLALSHAAADIEAEQMATVAKYLSQAAAQKPMLRDRAGVTRLFDGLDLVEPGVVNAPQWRPDTPEEAAMPASMWCGVARKG
jgi:S-adenosyl methyltransferase